MYFPLLVPECLLIEPTETETKEVLDAFADAMIQILEEAKKAGDFVSVRQFQQQMLSVQQQLRTLHSAVHLHV